MNRVMEYCTTVTRFFLTSKALIKPKIDSLRCYLKRYCSFLFLKRMLLLYVYLIHQKDNVNRMNYKIERKLT